MALPLPMLTRRAAIRRLRKAEAEVKRLERELVQSQWTAGQRLLALQGQSAPRVKQTP